MNSINRLKYFVRDELLPPFLTKLYRSLRGAEKKEVDPTLESDERAYREWNRSSAWNEIVLRPGIKLKISPSSKQHCEDHCFRRRDTVDEFTLFLKVAQTKKRLLDVGAYHGIFSFAFTAQDDSRRALAVEPSSTACPFLLYNIHANPACHVTHLDMALSDKNVTQSMAFDWQNGVALMAEATSLNKNAEAEETATRRGDDVCAEHQFFPDLIKIDVEGFEYRCLLGLQQVIETHRPLICLEIHPSMTTYGDSLADLATFFHSRNYLFYNLNEAVLDDNAIRQITKVTRVVVVPQEQTELLK